MVHKITYAVNLNDTDVLQQFEYILSLVGIQTKQLKGSDNKYGYFEASWDDADNPNQDLRKSGSKNAGAKPKQLIYNGEPVTCGFIFQLRNMKNLSDAEIGLIFDISESTISRRRKKHSSEGSFYEGSNIIF